MALQITFVDVTILSDYAPARLKFCIGWEGGEPFADGYFHTRFWPTPTAPALLFYTEERYLEFYYVYQDPGTYNWIISVSGYQESDSTEGSVTILAPTIRETINWEASVPNHGVTEHTFYLLSLYGTDIDGTLENFQIEKGVYMKVTTPSMSRSDNLTCSEVTKFDCLTIIAENYDGSTISGIYDWEIKKNVI